MIEHKCPVCGKSMSLVRVLPPLDDHPRLGAFYCRPCEVADTIPVYPDHLVPSVAPV